MARSAWWVGLTAMLVAACSSEAADIPSAARSQSDAGSDPTGAGVGVAPDNETLTDAGGTDASPSPACSFDVVSYDVGGKCALVAASALACDDGASRDGFVYECAGKIDAPLRPAFDDKVDCQAMGEPEKRDGWIYTKTVCAAPRCVRYDNACAGNARGYACPVAIPEAASTPAIDASCVSKGYWFIGDYSSRLFCCPP